VTGGGSTASQSTESFIEYPKLHNITVSTAYSTNVPLNARAYDKDYGWMKNTSSNPTAKTWEVDTSSFRITTHTPATAADTGTTGRIVWDSDYIYICTAIDTWKRVAIATW
jgi:hypothetical protein